MFLGECVRLHSTTLKVPTLYYIVNVRLLLLRPSASAQPSLMTAFMASGFNVVSVRPINGGWGVAGDQSVLYYSNCYFIVFKLLIIISSQNLGGDEPMNV